MILALAFVIILALIGVLARQSYRRSVLRARAHQAATTLREEHLAATRKCEFCVFWDHELGQRSIATNPTFQRVCQVRTPAEMAEQFEVGDDGEPARDASGNRIPIKQSIDLRKLQWKDLGACDLHVNGRFRSDVCGDFKRDEEATAGIRLRVLPDR
jgi:Tfp pilus assembly protein PilE